MECLILGIFAAMIITFTMTGRSLIIALLIGYGLFFGYGIYKKCNIKALLRVSWRGIKKVSTIVILMFLVGCLTAAWRSSGTIATIIYYSSGLFSPKIILPICFLLNAGMSSLMGTSMGTAATMGVITMGIATSLGISPSLAAGAIMSGVFVGDRCSPTSTCALLISEITETDLYTNIKGMLKTAVLPIIICILSYSFLGAAQIRNTEIDASVTEAIASYYQIHILNVLPAVLILIMALCRINVKKVLFASTVVSCIVSVAIQKMPVVKMLTALFWGYRATNPELAVMFDGGGIWSMKKVLFIIAISATYSGIFELTGLLIPIQKILRELIEKTNAYVGTLVSSFVIALVSCNQSLTVLLAEQLCHGQEPDKFQFAQDLENTAAMIPALIPWSICCMMPMSAIGGTPSCLKYAFYMILIPIEGLLFSFMKRKSDSKKTARGMA